MATTYHPLFGTCCCIFWPQAIFELFMEYNLWCHLHNNRNRVSQNPLNYFQIQKVLCSLTVNLWKAWKSLTKAFKSFGNIGKALKNFRKDFGLWTIQGPQAFFLAFEYYLDSIWLVSETWNIYFQKSRSKILLSDGWFFNSIQILFGYCTDSRRIIWPERKDQCKIRLLRINKKYLCKIAKSSIK